MENEVMLHSDPAQFAAIIKEVSDSLFIRDDFIEKDYWITLVLKRLSQSKFADSIVFKGGTSLSKGYRLINRFSEDVDIAVINTDEMTGNRIKTLIRSIEKEMTTDLVEIEVSEITSKGSRFRKAVYSYQELSENKLAKKPEKSVIIEVNSFGNASPWEKVKIQSMIGEYFENSGRDDLVSKYDLHPFLINVLDKNRTMIEKLASLIRFSFSEDPLIVLSGKVRHFYDRYFLLNDAGGIAFRNSDKFLNELKEVIKNDKDAFDEPIGWKQKTLAESPLVRDFENLWSKLRFVYSKELSLLAFGRIPDEKDIAVGFKELITSLQTP